MGLDKRLRVDEESYLLVDKKKQVSEIDMKPMNAKSFDIQNVLFDFCNVNLEHIKPLHDVGNDMYTNQKRIERFFGKIRKLPNNSSLIKNYGDKLLDLNDDEHDEEVDEDFSKECD